MALESFQFVSLENQFTIHLILHFLFPTSDYSCKLCSAELSNTYYHCCKDQDDWHLLHRQDDNDSYSFFLWFISVFTGGCENLMARDMNICLRCFENKRFYQNVRMQLADDRWVSDANHTGTNDKKRSGRGCHCRKGICRHCNFCLFCSCRCHHHFQQNQRFFTFAQLEKHLHRIREFVEEKRLSASGNGRFVEDLQLCPS